MDTSKIKSDIAKFKKQIADPTFLPSAKPKIKIKLENLEKELESIEGKVKTVEKKVETAVSSDVEKLKVQIAKFKKQIADPTFLASAKPKIKIKLKYLEEQLEKLEGKGKAEVKKVVKKVEEVATEKPATRRGQKKSVTKKPVVRKAKRKSVAKKTVAKKPKTTKPSEKIEVKGKTLTMEDCKEVLKEWNKKRKKAKASQTRSRSRSTSTRVSANVSQAIDTAIESVPAREIAENPNVLIDKFQRLKKAGEEFLNAFKSVLGDEYNNVDIQREFKDTTDLINELIKKYKD